MKNWEPAPIVIWCAKDGEEIHVTTWSTDREKVALPTDYGYWEVEGALEVCYYTTTPAEEEGLHAALEEAGYVMYSRKSIPAET